MNKPDVKVAETIPKNPTFVTFPCFSIDPAFRRLPAAEQAKGIAEFSRALEQPPAGIQVRAYCSLGLRQDTDFFLWTIAPELAAAQGLARALVQTGLGRYCRTPHNFVAMTRPSQYNPGHIPAFEKGEAPRKYLFLYPFVKTREWYLLPFEKRRQIMRGHMDQGERYPMVRLNTTYSFGLGDQDFVLAFETDQPEAFEDLVQQLRQTESSRYTVRDTPFILGTFCPTPKALVEGLGLG
ncbi:MAG: chlorite dismutase [Candidatus Omnitrophica bacterium CG11_big_fil_rev_8_21_14_0_20_64_10]|nr:MAG: chlorite dismutase [Candidatus Omnitrophica bacterium CG11_big_fil_rev_8_21_14_0_20_64_10]